MQYKKLAKKALKTVNKKIVKPYATGKNARTNRMKLYSEIAAIKKVINVEKKTFQVSLSSNQAIGQCNINAPGYYIADITPLPPQGITETTRNGSSIKLTGTRINMCFQQQSATVTPIKIKIYIVKIVGPIQTPSTWITNTFYNNQFVLLGGSPAIIDSNSERDMEYSRGYRILQTKTVYMPMDSITSGLYVKNIKFGVTYKNHHVRFNSNTTQHTVGQLLMYIQPDTGNCSTVTGSTLSGVPVTQINTGATFNYNITHYFVDN